MRPHRSLQALLFASVAVIATCDAWRDIAITGYTDEESGHILLAPLVIAWLLWSRRKRLSDFSLRRHWWGCLFIILGWASWSYGYRNQLHTLWHLGAVLAALGSVVTVFGSDLLFRFAPAVGALIFLIPIAGDRRQQIAGPLQLMTARVTQQACEIMGMTVDVQGSSLTSNGVGIEIAEACNGMRMVLIFGVVSYLFAFLYPLRAYVRVAILLLSPVIALICNVIRLVPTVWVYGHASAKTGETFHDVTGWVMILLGFGILTGIVQVLRWAMVPVDRPRTAIAA